MYNSSLGRIDSLSDCLVVLLIGLMRFLCAAFRKRFCLCVWPPTGAIDLEFALQEGIEFYKVKCKPTYNTIISVVAKTRTSSEIAWSFFITTRAG